jgi:predicted RNA binding protein YcfA (HicA-like mRNA interferase family)
VTNDRKVSEILKKWGRLKETELREVKKVMEWVESNFGGEFTKTKRGSHYKFHHPVLMNRDILSRHGLEREVINGDFSIPTVKGRTVEKCYLSRIKKVIKILENENE